jgi:hypothetical protein
MKRLKIISGIILAFTMAGALKAQYCNFFPMSKGMVLGYQNLDSKGKVTSKTKTTCFDVSTDDSGATIYKVITGITDAKDVDISSRVYEMKCKEGKFYMDVASFADPNAMKEFQNMAINFDANDQVYPEVLSAGQALPDIKATISAAAEGDTVSTLAVTISNRKVVGTEKVTVPAGVFDCFKISYNMELKSSSEKSFIVNEYITVGVGRIKTESFDKKGKLASSSVLVELKK